MNSSHVLGRGARVESGRGHLLPVAVDDAERARGEGHAEQVAHLGGLELHHLPLPLGGHKAGLPGARQEAVERGGGEVGGQVREQPRPADTEVLAARVHFQDVGEVLGLRRALDLGGEGVVRRDRLDLDGHAGLPCELRGGLLQRGHVRPLEGPHAQGRSAGSGSGRPVAARAGARRGAEGQEQGGDGRRGLPVDGSQPGPCHGNLRFRRARALAVPRPAVEPQDMG